jgi:two-component system, sensor histidine kinase LadS
LGLAWLFGWAAAVAQPLPPLQLAPGQPRVSLDGASRWWIDEGANQTVDMVEAAGESLPWKVRDPGQQYRIDGKALWFQFDAIVPGGQPWYLQLASSGLDRAQLFYRNTTGKWVMQEAGDTKAVSQWPLPGRVPTFELAETPGQVVRYWLRVEHARVDYAAPMAIYSQSALLAARESEQFLLGAYFGLAALIAIVAALNALAYRDRNFAAYAIYVAALSAGQVAYLGVGAQHVWNDLLKWNEVATFVLPGLSTAAALWFVQVVTEPARFSRWLNIAVWSMIIVVLLAVILDQIVTTRQTFGLLMALTALGMVMVILLVGLVWRKGDDPHIRLIALGFLPVLVMAAFPVARGLNLIPNSVFTRYGLSIGAALEMPILFYALSLRGSRRREAQVRTAALSTSDALTGLADTGTLKRRLESALAHARSQHHACALLTIKLANHGAIAAEYGSEIAERALVVTASVLRYAITDIDMAARVGTHQFAVLLEGPTTTENAVARAQQIVARGLQQSDAMPPTAVLRYQVAVAMLPDQDYDAGAALKWVLEAVNGLRPEARRAIRALNF